VNVLFIVIASNYKDNKQVLK